MGALPAQPRRADARDGDRRRARLHVPGLRRATRRCGSTSASAAGSRRCVENSRRRIELLHALLFSLPGTPIIYYGDEIGMGDNIYLGDRNGVRTPMQWTGDRNGGFSRADPARLYAPPIMDPVYGYQAINVEAQERDRRSRCSNWMKRMHRAAQAASAVVRPRHDRVRLPARTGRCSPTCGRDERRERSCAWRTCRAACSRSELDLAHSRA